MIKVLQQGRADGLCGVYAILNFLRGAHGWGASPKPNDDLWYLLNACQSLGWLDAYHITNGYHDWQLKAILDTQFDNFRMDYKSYFVSDLIKSGVTGSFTNLLDRVTKNKGAVIAHHDAQDHWVLIKKVSKDLRVFDSFNYEFPLQPLQNENRKYSVKEGIAIFPSQRNLVEIEL
ncbi:MAG: hypothetical protein WCO82_01515 [Sphingomonadales bacterium]